MMLKASHMLPFIAQSPHVPLLVSGNALNLLALNLLSKQASRCIGTMLSSILIFHP